MGSRWAGLVVVLCGLALPASGAAQDFGPAVGYSAPSQPFDVALADVDEDGRLDVATALNVTDGTSVLRNGGAGALLEPTPAFPTGDRAYAIAAADFDEDGHSDLAVANLGANTVSVLRGDGNGGFGPRSDFATGIAPVDVEPGDFDADGDLDLAVVNNGGESQSVSVLLGDGHGGFGPASQAPVGGAYPQQLALGDYDADGRLDVAVTVANATSVAVLLGHGDGGLGAPTMFPLPEPNTWSPIGIVSAEVNHDGRPDLLVAGYDRVWVMTGSGGGGFTYLGSYLSHVTGDNADGKHLTADDFNGDGQVDVAVANSGTTAAAGDVSVLQGRVDGSLGPPVSYAIQPIAVTPATEELGAGPNAVAAGDLDGDGRPDLVVGHTIVNQDPGGVSVLLNRGTWDPRAVPVHNAPTTRQGAKGRRPHLRIVSARLGHGRLRVVVRRSRAARGTVVVRVKRGTRNRWRRIGSSRRARSVHGSRLRAGSYRVAVRFTPATAGWRGATVKRRVAGTRGRR